MSLTVDTTYLSSFLNSQDLENEINRASDAMRLLEERKGPGNEFLGWLDLPQRLDGAAVSRIERTAKRLRDQSDAVLVAGIGGSYLGPRAAIEFHRTPLYNSVKKNAPDIWFVGNSLSPSGLSQVLSLCEGRRVSVVVISKSGTTLETAIAFRILRDYLKKRYGNRADERIVAITDPEAGALRKLAAGQGWETFPIDPDVGGRYSVLTPVGLLPMAVAGIDIRSLLDGAAAAKRDLSRFGEGNPCLTYAAARHLLYQSGRSVELFTSYEPSLATTTEWLRQLFGESEGKEHKGLFPSGALFSTDLHSLGQFIQEGSDVLFETVVSMGEEPDLVIPPAVDGEDGLDFLTGRSLAEVNRKAVRAVAAAHESGNTPSILVDAMGRDEGSYGYLLYFFEKACAVSGRLLGVNPFDQPGVEQYKKNIFRALGKPGC